MIVRGQWSPEQVGAMTFEDAQFVVEYWSRTPPLRDLVSVIAQLLGWEAPSPMLGPVEGEGAAALDVPGEFED